MGYFSNGTEGIMYQEAYCFHCAHFPHENESEPYCAVWTAHLIFDLLEPHTEKILDLFIPRNKDRCSNDKCTLFVSLPDTDNLTIDMFKKDK